VARHRSSPLNPRPGFATQEAEADRFLMGHRSKADVKVDVRMQLPESIQIFVEG
jgi:hypothetical protein